MKIAKFIIRLTLFLALLFIIGAISDYLSEKTSLVKEKTPLIGEFPVFNPTSPPQVSANYIFILDRKSGSVLYQKNPDSEIYPASTTKMVTAIVAYKHFSLDSTITVNQSYPEGVDIGLKPGETFQFANLLYALLVQSANDVAEVLAEAYPGGRTAFVDAMNHEVAGLGLRHTHFLNPTGLDQEGHYSSAADLTRIANHLLDYPYLAKVVSTENAVISTPNHESPRFLSNVNRLVGRISGVVGVKTGFTDLAGESVITLVVRDGHEVIISLLGSTDRFSDTEKIITWVFDSFTWTQDP